MARMVACPSPARDLNCWPIPRSIRTTSWPASSGSKATRWAARNLSRKSKAQFWTTPEKDESGDAIKDYARHTRNFLDCVKSRQQPLSDLESGHQVATACHLSNISLRLGRKLVWDADKEEIVGDPEANTWLVRPYRAPWDAELKALAIEGV